MVVKVRHDYDEPDFATIDTLFSLAEAHLFMQLVELQDANPGILAVGKGYADIYRSVQLLLKSATCSFTALSV